jgi:hypothetical protein
MVAITVTPTASVTPGAAYQAARSDLTNVTNADFVTKADAAGVGTRLDNIVSIDKFGAAAGTTSIAAAGLNIATVRSESGQSWLNSTDTADLAAYYLAQAYLDALGGGTIRFSGGKSYTFSRCAFVHSNITVDLNGASVVTTGADAGTSTNFARSGRCFVLGILAREDYPRFAAHGWQYTAGNIAAGDHTVTGVSGGTWSAGNIVLVRTTAEDATEPTRPLPTVVTFNRVKSVAGSSVTFDYPFEQAIASPLLINYSTIAVTKQSLVASGEPHVYYCAYNAHVINGTVTGNQFAAVEWNAALACQFDLKHICRLGPVAYGNALVRSDYVARPGSIWGGDGNGVEVATGSSLSRIRVDADFSGEMPGSPTPGNYNIVQVAENAFGCRIEGNIGAGGRACLEGLLAAGVECSYDLELRGLAPSDASVATAGARQTVRGRYRTTGSPSYLAKMNGAGDHIDAKFWGTPSTAVAANLLASNVGVIMGSWFESGKIQFAGSTSGNIAIGSYIPSGITTGGFASNRAVLLATTGGAFPSSTDFTSHTNSSPATLTTQDFFYGRTVNNAGAATTVTLIMGLASAVGMVFRAYRSASQIFRITPNGTETIGTGGAGKYIELGSDGAFIELRCEKAGSWVLVDSVGTITYEP